MPSATPDAWSRLRFIVDQVGPHPQATNGCCSNPIQPNPTGRSQKKGVDFGWISREGNLNPSKKVHWFLAQDLSSHHRRWFRLLGTIYFSGKIHQPVATAWPGHTKCGEGLQEQLSKELLGGVTCLCHPNGSSRSNLSNEVNKLHVQRSKEEISDDRSTNRNSHMGQELSKMIHASPSWLLIRYQQIVYIMPGKQTWTIT